MKWYVLQVMTGKEDAIKQELERLGYKASAPQKIMTERHQGRWCAPIRTVFPSYVFIKLDLTDEAYYEISGVPCVYRFLGINKPEPLYADEEEFILWLDNDGLPLAASEIQLSEGGRVKVLYGPLSGYEGQIVKIIARSRRAVIAITVGGQRKEFSLSVNVIKQSVDDDSTA